MILSVDPILNTPGAHREFQFELDLSEVSFAGRRPLTAPISVSGALRNRADGLHLSFMAQGELDTVCDRCGKPLKRELSVPYQCILAKELQNEDSDDIVLIEDGQVDVGELARAETILAMDTKTLCSEDCKGLCPRCGADLNLGPCSCKKEADPRLAPLAKLLEYKSE